MATTTENCNITFWKYEMENNKECHSRLYVVCKKALNDEPLDIGHSMLSVGHSVAIAFNEWLGTPDFETWRMSSFRKVVCQAEEKVLLDVVITSTLKNLVRNKTLKNILLLAKKFGREGTWSRKDMASVFQVSDARETVIIRILLKNNLITKITRGNYKFK